MTSFRLHLIDEMCVLAFSDDLEYWMIDEVRKIYIIHLCFDFILINWKLSIGIKYEYLESVAFIKIYIYVHGRIFIKNDRRYWKRIQFRFTLNPAVKINTTLGRSMLSKRWRKKPTILRKRWDRFSVCGWYVEIFPQVEEDFGSGKFVKYQICLWDLIEKPHTSMAAKVISCISIAFVVISTVGMLSIPYGISSLLKDERCHHSSDIKLGFNPSLDH